MFIRSAATDTLQGRAIHEINTRWGGDFRKWNGRETIGLPVCKKKYAPFTIVKEAVPGKKNRYRWTVQRMYGCHCHSHLRKKVIMRYGERKGWEPFGQWSIAKAKVLARKAINELGLLNNNVDENDGEGNGDGCVEYPLWKQICDNGSCAWKIKGKCDNVKDELNQKSGSKSNKSK